MVFVVTVGRSVIVWSVLSMMLVVLIKRMVGLVPLLLAVIVWWVRALRVI